MELVCTVGKPRVQHIRAHGSMDSLCGISYFNLAQIRQGQKGDGLPFCQRCECLENKKISVGKSDLTVSDVVDAVEKAEGK